MFFLSKKKEKINSEEFNILLEKVNTLGLKIKSLELDLELYVRKLKASKGLAKEEKEEEEKKGDPRFNVIIPQ